jgi:hypothetical protein
MGYFTTLLLGRLYSIKQQDNRRAERILMKVIILYLRYHPSICVEELRKTIRNLTDGGCPT